MGRELPSLSLHNLVTWRMIIWVISLFGRYSIAFVIHFPLQKKQDKYYKRFFFFEKVNITV